jgi:hypothetical protein
MSIAFHGSTLFSRHPASAGLQPSAALLLFAAVSGFSAAWGWQLIVAVEAIPGVQASPVGYWLVYSLLTALGTAVVAWLAHVCRVRFASALNRRPARKVETQDFVREYLLLRDARTRNRENMGWGGPCPSQRWKAYMARNAQQAQ